MDAPWPAEPPLALAYDDVLVCPGYADFLPHEADPAVELGRGLVLPHPIMSAAMDTVTEGPLAIAMAQAGGLGVLHRNQGVEAQAAMVLQVKQAPVLPTLPGARAALDAQGRLLVGGALGPCEALARAAALVEAGVDLLVLDTAHGHSLGVLEAIRALRQAHPGLLIVGGNVATPEGALALVEAGADVVKVGVGPGSICTTRLVAGAGVAQWSAVRWVAQALAGRGVPVVADGGLRHPGDLVKAIAAGASAVMLGGRFAACPEAPGELSQGPHGPVKAYRGMGSLEALAVAGNDRYGKHQGAQAVVAEGVAAGVPLGPPVAMVVAELAGGLRKGMGYAGRRTLRALQGAPVTRLTAAGWQESQVHDVIR